MDNIMLLCDCIILYKRKLISVLMSKEINHEIF
jgi:hypothetical protein